MVWLPVEVITIDKYPLSMVVDFEAQIEENRGKSRCQRPPKPAILEPIVPKPKTSHTSVERRAEELDTIASVLPLERRDELAELLTDDDIETLRHLVNQGMGDNTLRALTSDLAYLEAWGSLPPDNPCPGRRPRRCCSNSWPIICGIRKSAQVTPTTACPMMSTKI